MSKENHIMKTSKDVTVQNTAYVLPPIQKLCYYVTSFWIQNWRNLEEFFKFMSA